MHARITATKVALSQIDNANKTVQEMVLPPLKQQKGFKGYLGLVERQSGKSLAISLWESAADMQAAEEVANKVRSQSLAALHAEAPVVERFEVPVHEQAAGKHAGFARVLTSTFAPAKFEAVTAYTQKHVAPQALARKGAAGYYSLCVRQSGKWIVLNLSETEADGRANIGANNQMMTQAVAELQLPTPTIEYFEVLIHV